MKTKANAKKCQSYERTLQTKFSESHMFVKQTSIKCTPCCGPMKVSGKRSAGAGEVVEMVEAPPLCLTN